MYIFKSVNQPVSDTSAHVKVVSRAGRLWTQMTLILPQSEISGFQMLPDPGKALCFGDRKV